VKIKKNYVVPSATAFEFLQPVSKPNHLWLLKNPVFIAPLLLPLKHL